MTLPCTARLVASYLVLVAASPVTATETREVCEVPSPMTASFLLEFERIPRLEPPEHPESCFWSMVESGLPVVPELIELVADATVTPHQVPLFGGSYAVGDIATVALMQIVTVPVLDMVIALDPEVPTHCGFCAYWRFMRADPENRVMLSDELRAWYDENAGKLVWRPNPHLPAGGIWAVSGGLERQIDEVEE